MKRLANCIVEWFYRAIWKKAGEEWDKKMEEQFRTLHMGREDELVELVKKYRYRQIRMGILLGILLLFFLFSIIIGEKSLSSAIKITRNSYGEGQREESLTLENGEQIHFNVEDREYTKEQLEESFRQGFLWVRKNMLGDNESAGQVRQNLNFMTEVPGGFTADWFSQDFDVINNEGKVRNEEWCDPCQVYIQVQLVLSYQDVSKAQWITFCVREPEYTNEQKLLVRIKKWIEEKEEATRNEESFEIPIRIEGLEVRQSEEGKTQGVLILLAGVFFFVFFYDSNRIKDRGRKRIAQLEEDYPVLIHKMVLYLGAGMNLKKTFYQMAEEYKQDLAEGRTKERFVYDEMVLMIGEMKAGVGEIGAYETFGIRLGHKRYMQLISLLVQNLQKGNEGLLRALREEEAEAFQLRVGKAKKKAEEAGTRLLFPMLVMLIVVIMIVMVPAIFQLSGM